MNNSLQNAITLYCDKYLTLKKALYWKTINYYIKLCALAYTFEGNKADIETLLDAIKYIKNNSRWFSYIRTAKVYSAAYLTSGKRNIEAEFPRLKYCYDVLKEAGFSRSLYLPIAAYALYSTTPAGLEKTKAQTSKLIYDDMKKHHPFLTSPDDYASAVILASSDRPIDELINEIEATYKLLRESGFTISNGLQLLSQILVFDPSSPQEKALRCRNIKERLKQLKNRVYSMYYGTIGFLALTGNQWEEAINDVLEATEYFKKNKCQGIGEREFNLMVAAALVCKEYLAQEDSANTTLLRIGLGTTVEAIIAAQAATCVILATAAASSSSSSSS